LRFADFIGNEQARTALQQDVASGTLAHSYLLLGPAHVGKTTLALALAQAVNCLAPEAGDSCDECSECRRLMEGNHPDVVVTQAESGKDGQAEVLEGAQVSLEQAQALRARTQLRPYQGKWKVEILAGADRMTLEAANALLKTLEEPPADTLLILTATNLEGVLPTIQSRCRQVRLVPLEAGELRKYCRARFPGLSEGELEALVSWAGGCPGLALNLGAHPEALDKREELLALFGRCLQASALDAFLLAEEFQAKATAWWSASVGRKGGASSAKVQRTAATGALELFLSWLKDLLHLHLETAPPLRFGDKRAALEALKPFTTPEGLLAGLGAIQQARRALLANCNLQLTLEALLLNLAEAVNLPASAGVNN